MNDPRNVTQYGEKDIDQEVGVAATLEEDAKRWENDSEDDFADITRKDETSAQVIIANQRMPVIA